MKSTMQHKFLSRVGECESPRLGSYKQDLVDEDCKQLQFSI